MQNFTKTEYNKLRKSTIKLREQILPKDIYYRTL